MSESSDKNPGKDEKAEPDRSEAASADHKLPMVEAPKLDGEETPHPDADVVIDVRGQFPAGAPQPRTSRFVFLAATIAVAAALGSFIGTMSASGLLRLLPNRPATTHTADAGGVLQALKSQSTELSTIKSNLDGATRSTNAEFAKMSDRLNRVELGQTDPATKLAHIADAVDRLDKQTRTAPETTGSITSNAAANEAKAADNVLPDWIVQEVHGGRALVESRYLGSFLVAEGSTLPGLGRVGTVKRQDGQWVVVTARGVITSGR